MFGLRNTTNARCRTLVDIPQKTRTSLSLSAPKYPGRTGSNWKNSNQEFNGVADGPNFRIRTKVTSVSPASFSGDLDARETLPHTHGKIRIGLVVLKHDVKTRIEFLNPRKFKCKRLNLITNNRPLHRGSGCDHFLSTRMKIGKILKVIGQARSKVLCLTNIDDCTLFIAEPIDSWVCRDLACFRSICRRISHAPSLTGLSMCRLLCMALENFWSEVYHFLKVLLRKGLPCLPRPKRLSTSSKRKKLLTSMYVSATFRESNSTSLFPPVSFKPPSSKMD